METTSRKRAGNGGEEGEGRKTRARGGGVVDRTVTEAEVEEFFAILRRMHETTRGFAVRNGNGGGSKTTEIAEKGVLRWRPTFKWEDFEEANAVKDDGTKADIAAVKEESVAENAIPVFLDLNADPEPDSLGLGGPGGDSTAPVES